MNSKAFTSIKSWREETIRLTQDQLAKMHKTTQGMISRIECGNLPRYNHVEKFAKVYRLSIPEFKRLVDCTRREVALQQPQELPLWKFANRRIGRLLVASVVPEAPAPDKVVNA